jgi:hypothetical protein
VAEVRDAGLARRAAQPAVQPVPEQPAMYRGEFVAPAAGSYTFYVENDPQTQLDFNVKKGSIPPRTDVSVVGNPRFDNCTQIAAKIYNKSVDVVGNSALLISADEMGSVVDLVSEYFNSPEMKTDDALDRFAGILTKQKK